jgi:hypothetical protein
MRIWLPLALVAAVLSLLRLVSGSVFPGFALHLAFNAATLTLVLQKLAPVDQRLNLSWQVAALGWLASAVLVVAGVRLARHSDDGERGRAEDDAGY